MMALADVSLYVAIMAEVGLLPMIVTTQLSFNFLRKPAGDRALIGVCRLLKVGRTLAVGEATVYSEGLDEPVAHAVGSYAIPPPR
ncbi:PaaI family thioesterase [Hylemonella gracilis]|nr:PaaI family thioesterase [Hylemonella gracilis]